MPGKSTKTASHVWAQLRKTLADMNGGKPPPRKRKRSKDWGGLQKLGLHKEQVANALMEMDYTGKGYPKRTRDLPSDQERVRSREKRLRGKTYPMPQRKHNKVFGPKTKGIPSHNPRPGDPWSAGGGFKDRV